MNLFSFSKIYIFHFRWMAKAYSTQKPTDLFSASSINLWRTVSNSHMPTLHRVEFAQQRFCIFSRFVFFQLLSKETQRKTNGSWGFDGPGSYLSPINLCRFVIIFHSAKTDAHSIIILGKRKCGARTSNTKLGQPSARVRPFMAYFHIHSNYTPSSLLSIACFAGVLARACVPSVCDGIHPMHNSNIWTLYRMRMNFHRHAIRLPVTFPSQWETLHIHSSGKHTFAAMLRSQHKWRINNLLGEMHECHKWLIQIWIECMHWANFKFIATSTCATNQKFQLISIDEMDLRSRRRLSVVSVPSPIVHRSKWWNAHAYTVQTDRCIGKRTQRRKQMTQQFLFWFNHLHRPPHRIELESRHSRKEKNKNKHCTQRGETGKTLLNLNSKQICNFKDA